MIPIYVALVRNGLRTIDQVPAPIRDDVKAALGVKEEEPDEHDAGTGSDMSSPAWLTIIVSIITACGGGIVGWATKRMDAGWATKADIDRLAGEIAKIDVQLAKVCSKLDNDNRRLNSIEQSAMRSELFAATQDRTQHEHQLEVGKRYLAAGYNGAGHVRISQLKADYSRRLASDDWDY